VLRPAGGAAADSRLPDRQCVGGTGSQRYHALKRAERVAQASAPGSCKLQCPLVTSSAGIIGMIMPADDVTNGHCSLQLAATCDSLRYALRWLEIYYAYTKITRQACSHRQNWRNDAEQSMVKTATNPNNTYSSRDAYIVDCRLYTYMVCNR